jgi:hypothetical protein
MDPTPKRIKRDFEELGMDHDRLRDEGLGLLHTSALWRFMTQARFKKYNLRASRKNPDTGLSISANVIRLLEAALVSFTIGLVRLTILACVEESRRKAHTKVWHAVKDEVGSPVYVDGVHFSRLGIDCSPKCRARLGDNWVRGAVSTRFR